MADGQVVFEITGDERPINQSVRNVTDTIRRESRNWDNAVDQSSDNMTSAMNKAFDVNRIKTWALQAAKSLLDFGKQAIEAASDLAEVQNVVDTTFGDNSGVIDRWAKNAISQFGLTETKAKQFASTLGAMMKSAGMSGDSIVTMSTDLAGLAADMASFYNLDFETSFNKLRAGISGETEPLKQLGINMSQANLEAFALQQGLGKTYKEMNQGEQIMLRYQYIMQATSDAQGDFADTADGFANGTRLLQSNIEALKTNIGGLIEGPLGRLISDINSLFSDGHTRTVLDDFADIDAETEQKLAKIEATVDTANALTDVLDEIKGKTGEAMSGLADSVGNVPAIPEDTATNAGKLADSLEKMSKTEIKQDKLKIAEIGQAKVDHYNGVAASMSTIAESVNKLDESNFTEESPPIKAMASLETHVVNADGSVKTLKDNLEGLNTQKAQDKAEELAEAMEPVAGNTEAASTASEAWLKTCEKLVNTLPGLSTIINTQTGEIEGGTDAVREYVAQWGEIQTKMANINRLQQYEAALAQNKEQEDELYIDAAKKYQLMKINAEKYIEWMKSKGQWWETKEEAKAWLAKEAGVDISEITDEVYYNYAALQGSFNGQYKDRKKLNELMNDAGEAKRVYEDNVQANKEAAEAVSAYREDQEQELTTKDRSIIINEKAQEALKSLTARVDEAKAAMQEYKDQAVEATLESVNKLIHGFEKIEMPKTEDMPTMQTMSEGLQSQLDFMQEYSENLKAAKEAGLSDELLAELSDGSKESAAYLKAIAQDPSRIKEINDKYKEVTEYKKTFAEDLADNQLKVDEAYKELNDSVKKAEDDLDKATKLIADNIGNNTQEIANQINDHLPAVQSAIDNLNEILSGVNIPTIYVPFTSTRDGGDTGEHVSGSFASGLDYVPHDDFLARLHEGEAILTAEENRVWQSMRASKNGIDYNQLGSVMRDNVHPGGNVYLNGRVVGSVISDMQGNQYRNLQRSGWQS
jgi:hypothetical protein